MAISIITIFLFFIYSWGFGYLATFLIKNSENFLERNLMRIGIGIGAFSIISVILNFVHIPLHWWIFLVLALIGPFLSLAKSRGKISIPKFKLTKTNLFIGLALLIFFFSAFVYISGAFKYPYLEDDDPWGYSLGVKYVSQEKTLYQQGAFNFKYLDPYPPAYTALLGVLHQTSPTLSWTMKFFNGLIVSLSILFFYFFAKIFTKSKEKALLATFILASVPAFLTHFIWSIALAMALLFPTLYSLEQIKYDKRWSYVAAVLIAAILLSHPSHALKIGVMLFGYFVIKSLLEKRIDKEMLFAQISGVLLSMIWWAFKVKALFYERTRKLVQATGEELSFFGQIIAKLKTSTGTATRAYSFSDYFISKPHGLINNPVGLGILVCVFLLISLIIIFWKYKHYFSKENYWVPVSLFWLIFTFIGMNTETFHLGFGFFGFRFWMLFAIPVSLLSAEGMLIISNSLKSFGIKKWHLLTLIIIGILATSTYQKVSINTSIWPPGVGWSSAEELQGYLWLKENLPTNARVFMYHYDDAFITGLDMYSCTWCPEVTSFRENLLDHDAQELYTFLKQNKYEYLVISQLSYRFLGKKFGEDKTKRAIDSLLTEIQKSPDKFQLAYRTKGAVVLKVV